MVRFTGWGGSTRAIAGLAAMLLVAGMGSAATAITLDSTEELTTQSVEPEPVETPSDAPSVDPAPEPAPSTAESQDTPNVPSDDPVSEPGTVEDDAPGRDSDVLPAAGTEDVDPETPRLLWEARDENNELLKGLTFELQGPRDDSTSDDGADAQWKRAAVVSIEDNIGQRGYDGLDDDPAPGVFLVEKFDDGADVEDGATYRLSLADAEGVQADDDVEWTELESVTSDDDPVVVEVKPSEKASGDDADGDRDDQDLVSDKSDSLSTLDDEPTLGTQSLDSQLIQPLAAGPDGASPPYVYWETRDENNNLVGGATYQLQGPRTSTVIVVEFGVSWNTQITVTDCIAAPCAGPDLDPDPGEFLVKQIGSHTIVSSNRYRVRQVTPPTGYNFTNANNPWVEIPGTRNTPTGWSANGTYDFGDFQVRAIPPMSPTCDAGWVYGVSAAGQLRQVSPSGAVSDLGTAASGVSSFNGLGIGSGGDPVYAINRSGSGTSMSGTVWTYNTTTGTWTNTGHSTPGNNTSTNLVGGAVNLSTGLYYFGGFQSNGDFRVYEYNPAANPAVRLKGTVETAATSNSNGDMAFNANGDLFIVRGSGSNTEVYSVTAANFAAANGGNITSSQSGTVSTMSDVNGVAFDSSGRAFLGSGSALRSYAMPNWSGSTNIVTSGLNSTDLATCSSPATITIEKYVQGARVGTNDQFQLRLLQGITVLGTATTTGNQPGLQGQRVGPQPTVRGVTLNFTETASGTTNLNNYASSWSCYVDGEPMSGASGSGTSGSVTIPPSGDVIECRFTNAPLLADVSIAKTVLDAVGDNPQPGEGWSVGASASATPGTVTPTPSTTTQPTNENGLASWSLRFNNSNSRATVMVSETQQDGYQFESGLCAITGLDGTVREVNLTSEAETALTGIAPGDSVFCEYVNMPAPGELAIEKAFEDVPDGYGGIEFTGAYTCELPVGTVVASGTWTRTGTGAATLTADDGQPEPSAIPAGASCSVTENQPTGNDGLPNSSYEWGEYSVSEPVTIGADETSTVTVTNTAERVYGNFSVTKVVPTDSVVTDGMEFSGDWSCTLDGETKTGTWGPIAAGATWNSTNANEIPLGASCVVTEARDEYPVTDGSYIWDGDPVISGSVNAASVAADARITVTNTTRQVPGSVTWTKVDGDDNLLAGAVWTLTGPGINDGVEVADCVSDPCRTGAFDDQDPVAGQFELVGLSWGDYTLVEKTAPAGYFLDTTPHEFTIGEGELTIVLDPIENVEIVPPTIPLTGGIGRDFFFIAGGGVLLLGFGAVVVAQIRNRRREVA